jgi:hypothetical protein
MPYKDIEKRRRQNRESTARYRANNPERVKAIQKRYCQSPYGRANRYRHVRAHFAKRRAYLDQLKTVPCADCGQSYPPYIMDFDHVRGVKRFNVSEFGRHIAAETLAKELAKCDVVCANCHRERTHGKGKSARAA